MRLGSSNYWLKTEGTQSYQTCAGYSFESVCMKYIDQIIQALGLSRIAISHSTWQDSNEKETAQIDLVIEGSDKSCFLYEIKFCNTPYIITKEGALENAPYFASVDQQITLDALFTIIP
jgi:hypothetical protein